MGKLFENSENVKINKVENYGNVKVIIKTDGREVIIVFYIETRRVSVKIFYSRNY